MPDSRVNKIVKGLMVALATAHPEMVSVDLAKEFGSKSVTFMSGGNIESDVVQGVEHAGDGGAGFNTLPGARPSFFPEPFKGTDVRNCVGRRTATVRCGRSLRTPRAWRSYRKQNRKDCPPAEAGCGRKQPSPRKLACRFQV